MPCRVGLPRPSAQALGERFTTPSSAAVDIVKRIGNGVVATDSPIRFTDRLLSAVT